MPVGFDLDRDPAVAVALPAREALERCERHARGINGAVTFCHKRPRALRDAFLKPCRRRDVVDKPPGLSTIGAHPLGGGAEHISEVAPNLALVDEAGQPTSAG